MRKQLPLIIGLVFGLVAIISRYFAIPIPIAGVPTTDKWLDYTDFWSTLMGASAVLVGIITMTRLHVGNVRRRRPHWIHSVALLVAAWGYLAIGLVEGNRGETFRWIYSNVNEPLQATVNSLLAFYIVTAAYRAFRLRSREAAVMMLVTVLTMMSQTAIGASLWSGIPVIQKWLVDVPSTAGLRAVGMGVTMGMLATSLRVLLGLERAHLGN